MKIGAIMCDVRQGPWALKTLDQRRSSTISTAPAAKPETAAAAQSVACHFVLRISRRASIGTSLARASAARDGNPRRAGARHRIVDSLACLPGNSGQLAPYFY